MQKFLQIISKLGANAPDLIKIANTIKIVAEAVQNLNHNLTEIWQDLKDDGKINQSHKK